MRVYIKTLIIAMMVSVISVGNMAAFAEESVFKSGKTPEEIAADIMQGAKNRYWKEQAEKAKLEKQKVVMYSTQWCGYCNKARRYFKRNNIPYKEFDIEKNYSAKVDYQRLGGKGVPLIVMGGKVMRGFSERRFMKAYKKYQANL